MTVPAPLVPRSTQNPTGTTRIQRQVNAALQVRYEEFAKQLGDWVRNDLPVTVTERKSNYIKYEGNAARIYTYDLDSALLANMDKTIDDLIRSIIFDDYTQYNPRYFFSQAAELGYNTGSVEAVDNFTQQMPNYPRTVEFVLTSPPHRSRLSFIGSRAFEDLKGFNTEMKGKLRTILTQGMARGQSPLTLAAEIRKQVLGDPNEQSRGAAVRAKLLARTEISNAHRRALWDEHKVANGMGVTAELMHISALIPGRTRKTHAKRHGWTGSVEEEEEWYSQDGNANNCLCSTVSVLTDSAGKPLNPKAVEKQLKRREKYLDTAPETA